MDALEPARRREKIGMIVPAATARCKRQLDGANDGCLRSGKLIGPGKGCAQRRAGIGLQGTNMPDK